MNFQKKNKRFTKSSLISIIIAMIMCVGLSAQADVPLGDPVQVQVVDVNDNDTIVAAPDSDVNIYVRLVNVEFYTDPGIQAIQFVFTYPSDVLEIYYEEVDGKNIPNVDVFDVTSGDEDLLPWPVYAGFVDNTPGNPIIIGLAMNPVDAGWEDWDPGWYDADPPGDPPDFPIPPGEWPVNPEGIVYLMASGKIVEISAHVIGGPGDYPLVIDEILQEEIPPEEAIVPLAILNEYDYDPIPYDEPFPGTLRVGCPDTTPPVWDDTIGVQEVIPGPGQLTASWGTATDADSPPATYNLYYRDGTPVFDDPDTPNPDTIKLEDVTSPYTITGLIEGVEYCIVVRAQDSPEPPCEPNEDKNVVELCGTPCDTTPPVWDDTIGVQEVTPGPSQLTASWGTATDTDSPPVTYNLYYRDGSPVFTDPDTPHPDTIKLEDVTSPYTITGLTEGVEYCIVVRAQDSPEPPCEPNEDKNVVELCGTPCDITPPVWDDTIGVQEVTPGPNQLTASWGTATDADSPPVTYNLYYREGSPVFTDPDTPHPDTIKLEDVTSPYTITGLTPEVEYCIVVRAQDSPEPPCEPNEDDNVVELCGTPPPPSEVTLSILPEEKSVAVGETFTLDIQIDSGQIEIDRIDMYITYDPARLELQEHVPGDPFTPGDFLPPECPVFINDPIAEGILRYSQGCFGPSNSSEGLVASLTFEALDLPPDEVSIETYVDFDTDPDRPTIVGEKGETEPIYPNLFGSTVIIRSCTQVPVHVPLDMFEGDCAPIFFKVCQDGEVVRELEPVIIQYPSGETDLEICPALPDGIYSFYAKEYHYLSEVVTDVIIPLSEGRIEFPALRGGDTNNDNTIDFENDAWVLIGLFEQSHDRPCDFLPEPEADPEPWNADINGNKVVDFENDAWSLIGNFEQSGDECSEIAASPAYPIISGINRNSEFRLSVNASPLDYKGNLGIPIGEEFEVAILAHNTTDISVYTFDLSYDSRGLKLIKSEGATIKESRFLKQNTARKPTLLYREKDTGFSRHVTVLGGVIGQTAGATGNEVVVATLRFQAISEEPGMISLNRIKVADSKRGYNILPSQQLHLKAVPKQTVVLQNYPNPFNPETWIPYNLANDAEVVIKIYNVSGKMVRSLDLGQKSAGYHVTRHQAAYWNGINELGESVSSGVYFYTIQAGDFVATRKMILLK